MSHAARLAVGVVLLVLAPATASAQFSTYLLPVERGFVDSHVDLQFEYSRLEEDSLGGTLEVNKVILSVEAQYAIARRFEVGVNLPLAKQRSPPGSAGEAVEV